MKRIFYFLTVLALSAISFSCEKTDEGGNGNNNSVEPKADFDYEIEPGTGTVTFVNKSVDAVSYEWEFGDKTGFSTEENPVYTYEESGSYEVFLTAINGDKINTVSKVLTVEITVEKPEINITVDGKIEDWENIPWRDDIKGGGELLKIKTAATKDFIYILMQGTPALSNGLIPSYNINVDNDVNTGCQDAHWIKEGEDGSDLCHQAAGAYVYGWRSEEGAVGWDWIQDGWPEWITEQSGDYTYLEWKIDMKFGIAHMLENSIFEIPGQDYSKFATKPSEDTYRMHIGLFYDNAGVWEYLASFPEKGGIPFEIKVNEYKEAE